jgi:16S rRNA (guanine527-N7)-methyltransferase
MDRIIAYFPELHQQQLEQFSQLKSLYSHWNEKINVISRKDIEHLYEHHVLHSLAVAKVIQFKKLTTVLDVGTGGGFPGIPLAILFPEVRFHLIDSTEKKIKVVNAVISELHLENATAQKIRSNELKYQFDFVVSRAVCEFPKFVNDVDQLVSKINKNSLQNGILYLKGGDFSEEIKPFKPKVKVFEISNFFEEEYFSEKRIIYLPVQ